MMDSKPDSPRDDGVRHWRLSRLAWVPIPVLLTTMVALWVANLQVVWFFPLLYWLAHYGSMAFGLAFIVIPAARSFLANGQPSVLMLGCGVLMMDIGSTAMAIAFVRSSDTGFAIYNTSALLGALCHFTGVAITSRRRIRLRRSATWLIGAYAGGMTAMGLVIWLACVGWLPVFFIDAQGGTLLRSLVVSAAVVLFLLTAGLLWQTNRRTASPFLYWYALGLVLLAAGLAGSMLIAVSDSPLQWVTRFTQVLGTVYMCVAVLASARRGSAKGIALSAVEEAWRENALLARLRQQTPLGWMLRYGMAVAAVAAAIALREATTAWVGPGLPTYITFYPIVMAVALLAGFGPGVLATALAGCVVGYWVLPPAGQFAIGSPVARVGLVIFTGMGLFMSVVAEVYRRNRDKATAYDQELALRDIRQEKEFLANLLEHAAQPFAVGYPDGRIGRLNRAYEELTGYTAAELHTLDWSATLTPPEWRELEKQTLDELNRTGRPIRYEKEYVRKDGSRVSIELLVHLVRDAKGRPEYYYSFIADITERKRTQEALKENERRLREARGLLEAVTLGTDVLIATVDRELRYTFFNQGHHRELKRLTGKDTAIGMSLMDVLADMPQERDRAVALWGRALKGQTVIQTLMFGDPGRHRRWYNTRRTPIRDADGAVVGAGEVTTDVTELMQAEEALRESEERLRLAQDGANVGIWDWTPLSGEIKWTPESERLYGATPGTIRTYEDWRQRMHPDDVRRVEAERDAAIAAHQPFDLEFRIRHDSGEIRWIAAKGSAIYNDTGDVIRVLGMNIDITERKRAEESLAQARAEAELRAAELQTVLDTGPVAIWIAHDAEARAITGNAYADTMVMNIPRGGNISRSAPSDEVATVYRVFRNGVELKPEELPAQLAIATGRPIFDQEMELRFDDGRSVHMIASAAPLFDAEGRARGSVTAAADVTRLKKAEEALRDLNATLESKVAERTAELELRAKQLQRLTFELTRAEDRERKRIAEILHEDLQQQIAGAKFHLGLLSRRTKDDVSVQAIADRTDEMLKEAIEKSRTLSHDLSPAVLHMNDLMEVLQWLANRMRAQYGLTVHVAASSEPTLQSEALTMFLFRAAQEMLFNVVKHAKVQEATVRVRRLGRCLCLSVRDRGCGFDPRELKETTGYGLLSIRERIELLGGRMKIRSAKGRGSRFHVVVPDTEPDVR